MTSGTPGGVVIVGGGQAAVDTAFALRLEDYAGPITVLSGETDLPYRRPQLSKELLVHDAYEPDLLRDDRSYEQRRITLRQGVWVVGIERSAARVILADGSAVSYDHLVLATGAEPRRIELPRVDPTRVFVLRSLSDALELRKALESARTVAVIGGGYIGLEVAAAARAMGLGVTVHEASDRLMGRGLSREASDHALGWHQSRGTEVRLATTQDDIDADVVMLGVGVVPNTRLAEGAGLTIDNGVLVDEHLRTSDPRIFAIGDVARFPTRFAPAPVRLESIQNASDQARHVAAEIASGVDAPFDAVPWFWTDQGDLNIKMAGLTSGYERAITLGDLASGSFSVLCFRDGLLVGVDSVNDAKRHRVARRRLAAAEPPSLEEASQPGFDLRPTR
jgi:3-phenylpropionate/trans-cinnamate dioxygenase ferredoxin reductase subunit